MNTTTMPTDAARVDQLVGQIVIVDAVHRGIPCTLEATLTRSPRGTYRAGPLLVARTSADGDITLAASVVALTARAGIPEPIDADLLAGQHDWGVRAFGPGARLEMTLGHIRKEVDEEIQADPYKLDEWIDVAILAFGGAMRHGATPAQVLGMYRAKLAMNATRTWPDWRTQPLDQPILHIRVAGEADTPPTPAP